MRRPERRRHSDADSHGKSVVWVVVLVGMIGIGALALSGILAWFDCDESGPLISTIAQLPMAAMTGLLGLLAKTASGPDTPAQTEIVNPPTEPVPVEAVGD